MKVEIRLGKSHHATATCTTTNLLDALLSDEVRQEIAQSLIKVRVITVDADGDDTELATAWFDESIAHEAGKDWDSIAEDLAVTVDTELSNA